MTAETERRLIGHVSVDSGLLSIVDPGYLSPDSRYKGLVPDTSTYKDNGGQLGSGSWGSAVVARTRGGDGIFPVYDTPEGILIALEEWQWDNQDGKGVRSLAECARDAMEQK